MRIRIPARLLQLALLAVLVPASLIACSHPGMKKIQETARYAVTAVSSYKSALYYYEKGDIMLARRAAIRTDEKRPDYEQAQKFLREKIEPARLKLLRHFRREAVKAERKGKLYRARELYQKTADVWVGDDKMKREVARVDLIMRQKRLDDLTRVRRKEDAQLFANLDLYDPPRGLAPDDAPYVRELGRAQNRIQARARAAWKAARQELHEGHPEIAYVEAESYQRLRPGSRRGKLLMEDVLEAMPKGLKTPSERHSQRARHARTGSASGTAVSVGDIRDLIRRGKWIEAHAAAMIYRRDGGDEADELLQIINNERRKLAEAAFQRGQTAFQSEQLDRAVAAWSEAVVLQPNNRDYNDSLRRATELQERFRILQGSTN